MADVGRPVEYTPKAIEEIRQLVYNYTTETDLPRISDFCYKNNIRKQRISEFVNAKPKEAYYNEYFSDTIKRMEEKEESKLWEMGLTIGKINTAFGLFRLKQSPFNYSDRQDITITDRPTIIEKDI